MGKKSKKKVQKDSVNMSEKLVVEVEERSIWSVFAGMVMVFLGIMLVVAGIVAVFLYRGEPKLDKALPKPELTALPNDTNTNAIMLRGEVDKSIKRVAVYVNDKEVDGAVWVDNGSFRYEYSVEKEGLYRFQASSISGFPIRKRSERTDIMAVNVDWTAPSKIVSYDYKSDVDTEKLTVKGEAEPLSTLVFSAKGDKHVVKVDKDGKFLATLPLSIGENTFDVEVRDSAGNSVKAEKPVIAMRTTGSLNGNGATDGPDLPEASGELEAAMAFLLGNKLMSTFGLLALFALILNSAIVLAKVRKYSV